MSLTKLICQFKIKNFCLCINAALRIGFDQVSYSFDEDQASKQACIIIEEGSIEGNLQITLTVQFSDGTATGKPIVT